MMRTVSRGSIPGTARRWTGMVLAAAALLAPAGAAHGQEVGRVLQLEVTLRVERDGTLQVSERLVVRASGTADVEERMLIQRSLPRALASSFGGTPRVVWWEGLEVEGPDGDPRSGRLRGGRQHVLLQTFASPGELNLRYRARGAVERSPHGAGLSWTAVPPEWTRDLEAASVRFVPPLGATGVQVALSGGTADTGSRPREISETEFLFQYDFWELSPGTSPDPIRLMARWDGDIMGSPGVMSTLRLGMTRFWPFLLPLASLGLLWYERRERFQSESADQLLPGLGAAEAGFLFSLDLQPRDLVASVEELAEAGWVEARVAGGSTPLLGLERDRRIAFRPAAGASPLPAVLEALHGALFTSGRSEVGLTGADRPRIPELMRILQGAVVRELVSKGLLERPPGEMARYAYSLSAGLLLVGGALAAVGVEYLLLTPGVAMGAAVLTALPWAFRGRWIPPWTPLGRKAQMALKGQQEEWLTSGEPSGRPMALVLLGPSLLHRGSGFSNPAGDTAVWEQTLGAVEGALSAGRALRTPPGDWRDWPGADR